MTIRRWGVNAALAAAAVALIATALLPQFLVTVGDEESWRARPAVPTIDSLNDYLKNCDGCLHRPEVLMALTEAGRPAGLLAWLNNRIPNTRRPSYAQILQGGFSPDGSTVLTAGSGFGSVYSLATGERTLGFSPTLSTKTTRINDYEVSRVRFGNGVEEAVFLPGAGSIASITSPGTVVLWDAHSGAQERIFETKLKEPSSLAASPDGRKIAFVNRDSDRAVSLDPANGKVTEYAHAGVEFVAFPTAETLVTASNDRTMWWRLESSTPARTVAFDADPASGRSAGSSVGFSADSELALHIEVRGPVQVWGTRDGKRVQALGERAGETHESEVTAACSPGKSTFVATGTEDGYIHLWDHTTGARLAKYRAHASHVDRLICHGASKRILSIGHRHAEAKVWSVESFGKEVAPVLRGQATTGSGWAAQLASDANLTGRFPGVVEFFIANRNETSIASFLGLVGLAIIVSWRRAPKRFDGFYKRK